MPDFLPPKVVGEISTLNTYVIVENHLAGTTLKVWANGVKVIGTKTGAAGGHDQITIDPSFLPLTQGMAVTATQEDPGGPPSNPSPDPVIVQSVPNPLNQAQFDGTVYRCVDYLGTFGLTPGAKFEVHQPGASGIGPGSLIGKGETYNGPAEAVLTTPVSDANPLILRQIAGPLTSDAQYPMPIVPVPLVPDQKLPRISIVEALDCGYYTDFAGTINGVKTKITRHRGSSSVNFVGYGSDVQTRFWVSNPFRAGDVVTALQSMAPRCEIKQSDPSDKYQVQDRLIHAPLIVPPVCLDALELELLNIEPGAEYSVYAIYKTVSGDKQRLIGKGRFPVKDPDPTIPINRVELDPDQLPGTVPSLVINQTACGWASPFSPAVPMEPLGAPTNPKLPERLFACAVYVRVTNVRPGSWVSVHSKLHGGKLTGIPGEFLGGRIGRAKAGGQEVSVHVPSGLISGDTVWACATGCQDPSSHSGPASVEPPPSLLQAHIVDPVYPIDKTITVQKLTTGARVITRVLGAKHPGGQKLYTSYAWAPEIPVYVGDVFLDDKITVFQSLCHSNATENQGNTASVILGTMDVSIAPTSTLLGATTNFMCNTTDPARNKALVAGDVLFNGTKVGLTNTAFAWTAPGSGSSAAVQVIAAGYKTWSGSIALTVPLPPSPPSGGGVSSGGGTETGSKKPASYSYTCEPLTGGVKFTVTGLNFPTLPGTNVTITPQFDGIFTAFGKSNICGIDAPSGSNGPFGPFPVDATGKFTATVTVVFGCQPTCSVRLFVSCNKLMPGQITDPGGPYCKCN
jgi:hypothetical protein